MPAAPPDVGPRRGGPPAPINLVDVARHRSSQSAAAIRRLFFVGRDADPTAVDPAARLDPADAADTRRPAAARPVERARRRPHAGRHRAHPAAHVREPERSGDRHHRTVVDTGRGPPAEHRRSPPADVHLADRSSAVGGVSDVWNDDRRRKPVDERKSGWTVGRRRWVVATGRGGDEGARQARAAGVDIARAARLEGFNRGAAAVDFVVVGRCWSSVIDDDECCCCRRRRWDELVVRRRVRVRGRIVSSVIILY